MNKEALTELTEVVSNNITGNMSTVIFALLVLIIGIMISKLIKRYVIKFLNKLNFDQVIASYISYSIYVACIGLTIMATLSMIGIPIDSLVALIAVVFLSLGIAFKATLENVGSGFILLFFKPFKTGDYIESNGIEGIVSDMHIFSTTLKTFDNKAIIVPNSKLTNQSITNYTKQENRRIDIVFNLPHGTDMDNIKKILTDIFDSEANILKRTPYLIGIRQFKENSLEILATAWVDTDDYWDVFYSVTAKVEKSFRENNIELNIPQRVIYQNYDNK